MPKILQFRPKDNKKTKKILTIFAENATPNKMPVINKTLTDREKAAITFVFHTPGATWKQAYIIADERSTAEAGKSKYINTQVSRWRNLDKVQNYIKYLHAIQYERDQEQKQRYKKELEKEIEKEIEENEETQGNKDSGGNEGRRRSGRGAVDYSDPNERRQLYNRIITEAKCDPKTQLDAAKLIEQTQRDDRQAAQERRQVAAYLPQRCYNCPLYLDKKFK